MTLAEFPDSRHPAHVEAVTTKAWVREHLRRLTAELAADTNVTAPDALADQLVIIMEGVYATVQAFGADGPAKQASTLAATLLDAVTRPEHTHPNQ
jgi:hypothetical protein